ncbi:MAG: gliding motility-associated ABC transporter permease subunit GldF [Flavobacteriales bacterium]
MSVFFFYFCANQLELKPMWALFKKEITGFFGSLTGYIVIAAFLMANALFMWLLPGNVFESGYAAIDPLFMNAPFIYLLLIPAITMRAFAEEKKAGTIESLLTKPLSDLKIVLAKYFAGFTVVVLSLLPTLVYVLSIYQLASPKGDIDLGGIWGSYLGLLLLGSVYVAVGIFTSTLTENQIIALVYSVVLCLFLTWGLDMVSKFNSVKVIDLVILNLGISEHYNSISRGVVDSRDVLYFLSANVLFLFAANLMLQKRKW